MIIAIRKGSPGENQVRTRVRIISGICVSYDYKEQHVVNKTLLLHDSQKNAVREELYSS